MNIKNTEKQAIIWGRHSSEKQSDGDSKGRQERLNRAYAKRKGIEVVAEYYDESQSVKIGTTQLFDKVVAELPSGIGIICENLDRLSRGHPWKAKAYFYDIIQAGHFIATTLDDKEYNSETIEKIDTMMLGDIGANVARYSNNLRISRVREEKNKAIEMARKGLPSPLGAWLPSHLKYNFETKQYDVKNDIKDIIQRIFSEYSKGKGTSNIARGLNDDGTLTFVNKKAGQWTRSTISQMLRYEGVIGTFVIKGRIGKVDVRMVHSDC